MTDYPDASQAKVFCLWTVWADYFATGEGRTLSASIGYASSAEEAIMNFEKTVHGGDFYKCAAEAEQGVIRNTATKFVFSEQALDFAETENGKAHIAMSGQVHFNFS